MKHFVILILIFVYTSVFGQDNTLQQGTTQKQKVKTDQEVYNKDKKVENRVMIIPFEEKMYMSGIDREIAFKEQLSFSQIRRIMRQGLTDMLLLEIKKSGFKTVSMLSTDTTIAKDLKYIYYSIGYKYEVLPTEQLQTDEVANQSASEKVGKTLNKLFKKEPEETKEEGGTRIEEGQIVSYKDEREKFMNTRIINPNMLEYLAQKYASNLFVFINELDIEEAATTDQYAIGNNAQKRRIKVHFSIFNAQGKEIYAGAAITNFSSLENKPNAIVNKQFTKLAGVISEKLPQPEKEEIPTASYGDSKKLITPVNTTIVK